MGDKAATIDTQVRAVGAGTTINMTMRRARIVREFISEQSVLCLLKALKFGYISFMKLSSVNFREKGSITCSIVI